MVLKERRRVTNWEPSRRTQNEFFFIFPPLDANVELHKCCIHKLVSSLQEPRGLRRGWRTYGLLWLTPGTRGDPFEIDSFCKEDQYNLESWVSSKYFVSVERRSSPNNSRKHGRKWRALSLFLTTLGRKGQNLTRLGQTGQTFVKKGKVDFETSHQG